jgi:hypothetical protein
MAFLNSRRADKPGLSNITSLLLAVEAEKDGMGNPNIRAR